MRSYLPAYTHMHTQFIRVALSLLAEPVVMAPVWRQIFLAVMEINAPLSLTVFSWKRPPTCAAVFLLI